MFKNFKNNFKNIKYTSLHWLAYQKTAHDLNVWSPRHLFHDIDKLFLYIIFDKKQTSTIHRKYSNHHVEFKNVGALDYKTILDAIIDWECARHTKLDKPLSARETLREYHWVHTTQIEPILQYLGL